MKTDRWPARHPLCTCPELTWANFATFDRPQCMGGTTTHPVVGSEDLQRLIDTFKERHADH